MGKLNKATTLLAAPFSMQSKQTGLKTVNTKEQSLLLRWPARLGYTDVTKVLSMSGRICYQCNALFALLGYTLCSYKAQISPTGNSTLQQCFTCSGKLSWNQTKSENKMIVLVLLVATEFQQQYQFLYCY